MTDPYQILGISSSASNEEVTQAYRKLAKKYHPDINPGDKAAEAKMREVNAAYEQIKNKKTGGAKYERADGSYGPRQQSPGGGGHYRGDDPFGGFDFSDLFGEFFSGGWEQQGGYGGGQSSGGHTPMQRQARLYLQNGQYNDAWRVLSQMKDRDAEWYYLSALAQGGTGNRVTALSYAKDAVRLQPNNLEYQQLLRQFEQGSFTYRQRGQSRGFDMQTAGRSMLQLLLAQVVCCFCCRIC